MRTRLGKIQKKTTINPENQGKFLDGTIMGYSWNLSNDQLSQRYCCWSANW